MVVNCRVAGGHSTNKIKSPYIVLVIFKLEKLCGTFEFYECFDCEIKSNAFNI